MPSRPPGTRRLVLILLTIGLAAPCADAAPPITLAGAKVELVDYQGPAAFTVRSTEKFRLEISVTPNAEREPLTLRIDLAESGRETWPVEDVEVRDSAGQAVPVRRAGIEWHRRIRSVRVYSPQVGRLCRRIVRSHSSAHGHPHAALAPEPPHLGTSGSGPIYQGRFKCLPVQSDEHFLTVARYIERNPLRAKMVEDLCDWRWSSLWRRCQADPAVQAWLSDWPVAMPDNWLKWVRGPQSEGELEAVR